MQNGDRQTGEVPRQDDQVLKLKTDQAGSLVIDWHQVATVHLDQPREALMGDETVVSVTAAPRSADRVSLRESPESAPMTVDVARVQVVNPEPWELDAGYKLGGQIHVALKSERGKGSTCNARRLRSPLTAHGVQP